MSTSARTGWPATINCRSSGAGSRWAGSWPIQCTTKWASGGASAAGAARNPAWYHNIAAHPDQVRIEVGGRMIPVTAGQLHGAERDQAWQQVTAATPRFAAYQRKTDRELPVIRLLPRSG